ncbi:MAG: ABC transporter ATP-binding protein [Clostridia bacterium]|nr:ABC transporter ATP-binding protein [Clostridia bacterium]
MISVENIEKSYNSEKVLKNASLKIEDSEFVSIMGKSGSGKSTLISIMGGFLAPDSGRVLYDGKDIFKYNDSQLSSFRCTKIGFVFQAFGLIPTLNVMDNLLLPSTLGKSQSKEQREYILELCKALEIDTMLKKYPDELSGGQCQRVAIVRALSYEPSVVILDEPTGALDSAMEKKVMELLVKINKEKGTTIIQVTHSERVASYGTRIIKINDGEIA